MSPSPSPEEAAATANFEIENPRLLAAIEQIATVISERAAKAIVREVLVQLGINAEKASDQIAQQKDQAFLRRLRESAESRPAQLGMAMFGALLSFGGALAVIAVQYAFGWGRH